MKPTLVELKKLLLERAPLRKRREIGRLSDGFLLEAGNIIEVSGLKRQEYVVEQLDEQLSQQKPHPRVAWVTNEVLKLFPFGLAQRGFDLKRFLFVESVLQEQGVDVLLNILKSNLFDWVVFQSEVITQQKGYQKAYQKAYQKLDAQLRKIQLTAEESGSALFVLSERPLLSFTVSMRVLASGAKNRNGGKNNERRSEARGE